MVMAPVDGLVHPLHTQDIVLISLIRIGVFFSLLIDYIYKLAVSE